MVVGGFRTDRSAFVETVGGFRMTDKPETARVEDIVVTRILDAPVELVWKA